MFPGIVHVCDYNRIAHRIIVQGYKRNRLVPLIAQFEVKTLQTGLSSTTGKNETYLNLCHINICNTIDINNEYIH